MKTSSNLSHFTRRNGLFHKHKHMIKQRKSQRETHFSILSTPLEADIIAVFLLLFFYLLPF